MKSKILKACLILGLAAAVNTTYAIDKPTPAPDFNTTISAFITGCMNTDYKMLDKVMADDAAIKMPRADAVLNHSRSKLIEQMKKEAGTHQNCEFKYSVLEKSNAMVIAKVDFKYAEFTQHNYLVLEKNDNKEWKITQVCRFFEDAQPGNAHPEDITATVQ